ncbi:ABC transporter G family member 29 [Abeliophyllum distichum]|uniref:ABC transporter G family member 29 n=1 Tax=Abeliophyllum distichum TaxID=126358 RepID=A0ABD1Q3U3_9LAMI
MSLLQLAPETFDLFDDIILLSEDHIIFQGSREHVVDFFESCGFKCPDRKATADFLQETFVDEWMDLVELDSLKNAIVGISGVAGLSTEQRKRLTIGVELVANPSIIFMDEPISGLDAIAIVMRTVRNPLDTGITVVCTIHQPSIDIFESFDEAITGVPKIKEKYNPAAWMLEVSSVASKSRLGMYFSEYYKSTNLSERNKVLVEELSTSPTGAKDLYFSGHYSQTTWGQFKSSGSNGGLTGEVLVTILLGTSSLWFVRSWLGQFSGESEPKGSHLILGESTSSLVHGKSNADLLTIMGAMYASAMFVRINNCATVHLVVAIERTVFYRKRGAGMYAALPYVMSQVVVEVPYALVIYSFSVCHGGLSMDCY